MANQQKSSLFMSAGVVKARLSGLEEECSASATVLPLKTGAAISHGSLLLDFCLKNEGVASKIKNGAFLRKSDFLDSNFNLLLNGHPSKSSKKVHFSDVSNSNGQRTTFQEDSAHSTKPKFVSVPCEIYGAFRNMNFHKTLCQVMPDNNWTFTDQIDQNNNTDSSQTSQNQEQSRSDLFTRENYLAFQLLSYFIIFKYNSSELNNIQGEGVLDFPSIPPESMTVPIGRYCQIGDTAEIVSTPFAGLSPSVFLNSYSVGVVSNVRGTNNCWILTDARCVPGSEGAPLYTWKNKRRYLTGIIASPMCWKNNEWVGFAVACSLDSIYQALPFHLLKIVSNVNQPHMSRKKEAAKLKEIAEAVYYEDDDNMHLSPTVLVEVGNTWGSGVIINKDLGLVITCSHVIKDSGYYPVTISTSKSPDKFRATVIYRQNPLECPYDIALLQCFEATRHLPKKWSIQTMQPCVGEAAYAIGHALFDTYLALQPSLTKGVVSKVIHSSLDGKPILVQSTCAVHPGASGGPLLSEKGQLIGIIVCNIRDSSNHTSFPHLNLCVPAVSIWPFIQEYIKTQDARILSSMKIDNPWAQRLWALGNAAADHRHLETSKL